jgi:hypothetical protein
MMIYSLFLKHTTHHIRRVKSIGGSMLLFRPSGKKVKLPYFNLDLNNTLTFQKEVIVVKPKEKEKMKKKIRRNYNR